MTPHTLGEKTTEYPIWKQKNTLLLKGLPVPDRPGLRAVPVGAPAFGVGTGTGPGPSGGPHPSGPAAGAYIDGYVDDVVAAVLSVTGQGALVTGLDLGPSAVIGLDGRHRSRLPLMLHLDAVLGQVDVKEQMPIRSDKKCLLYSDLHTSMDRPEHSGIHLFLGHDGHLVLLLPIAVLGRYVYVVGFHFSQPLIPVYTYDVYIHYVYSCGRDN